MLKKDYFIEAIQAGHYQYFNDMLALFTRFDYGKYLKPRPYGIIVKEGKYNFLNSEGNYEVIDDAGSVDKPLLSYLDTIELEANTFVNQKEALETTFGNVYVNALGLTHWFKDIIPFPKGKWNVRDIEKQIANVLVDDPKNGEAIPEGKISTTQHIEAVSALQTLEDLGPYVVHAATVRNIQPPKNIEKEKERLLKQYEGQLDDPVIQVKIVSALQAFDEDWLKDDPSNNILISGKIKKVSRTKMYLAAGTDPNFTEELTNVFNPKGFIEGSDHDSKEHARIQSANRYGSYGRGTLTAIGGTISKSLMQILTALTVEEGDCGTELALSTRMEGKDELYLGRYVLKGKKLTLLTKENIQEYKEGTHLLRSPMYCKLPATEICSICAGKTLQRYKKGLVQAGTALGVIIIYQVYFAIIKGNARVSTDIDLDSFID